MQPTLCNRCQKNIAVVFVTRMEGDKTTNEGYCLKCAKELGIAPASELMDKMGITDEDLDAMAQEMAGLMEMGNAIQNEGDEDDPDGKTATFPFLNNIFGGAAPAGDASGENPPAGKKDKQKKNKDRKFLNSHCISLTEKAKEGKLDRIIGREKEIERVIQILNRRQKNNPCLIGEPGVGKTAIAEGLAIRINEGNVPGKLLNREVYLLDLTSLVAGTQFRGQFESRMKGLIEDIKRAGNIILVIDEVHTLVSAGDAEGSMNAANILKPALSRGEIQVIGATTFTEYRKSIEKDTALERRFQSVIVNEPSIEETVEILTGISHYYEEFHGVRITEEIARLAAVLSERYITDRFLPDKAIDLIDEAASDLNLKSAIICEREKLTGRLSAIETERNALLAEGEEENTPFEELARLKSEELQCQARLDELNREGVPELTIEHLARVIELWTDIPASSIQETEFARLHGLADRLKSRIIGQDAAIDSLAAAIKRGRVGISLKRKPVSFIFVGPTGVGKTELVKQLASDMFSSPESLIRLDMSEFMEKHAVSRIIGAPPGYVGYDEAGQLTEKIRRRPYSVILFDEIEKAHPDVLNILLQILDDGRITDAQGRVVNFENTVIIMTSNAGSQSNSGSAGFNQSITEVGKDKALKALSDFLRPEFVNRIDEIIAFNSLTRDDFVKIAHIMLSDLKKGLDEKKIAFTYDDNLVAALVEKSFSIKYGARNLRRTIQKELEDKIANILIDRYSNPPTSLFATVENSEITIK
ncbi:MAG: ATP-dependent Clp protease ATP-binding subunit [Clostridia bacterium]|nr:ATP-dependent Clp protease ATP-binding subunit [Clostridia bacterium]